MDPREKIVYQIWPRSFCDGNGDGVGDLGGVIAKLDYLHELGVDLLWLSPVYASPNRDYGYDVSDYYAINPEYGTLAEFDRLVAEAKARGITRAYVSMERAAALPKPCIFAIGNAPTALCSLEALMEAGKLSPALIIGVPVGFVNVVESKELVIEHHRAPYIIARGRKGGSNVAAAICNALLYQIRR